jgi:hypothetical protein
MLLEAVHGLVSRLAVARGWDPTALEACRQHALDNGLEYRWVSDPKASMVPYDFVPAIRGGQVTLRRAGEEWSGDVEVYMAIHVEGRGATAP